MKKWMVLGLLVALSAPVFAGDKCDSDCPMKMKGPKQGMMKMDPAFKAKMEAEKAQRKARKARFKQTEEKLEKLVKQYKSAKEGSKKQAAAREEIAQVLSGVRDEQIAFRAEKLQEFEARLGDMKAGLAREQEPAAKAAWVEQMTQRVISEDGDLEDALEQQGRLYGPKALRGPAPMGPQEGHLPPPPSPGME